MKMAFHLSFSNLKTLLVLATLYTLECTKGCVERERLGLLDFKKSFLLNDGKLSSWNSSEDARNCCAWEGIICESHTWHVVSLDLSFQNLESHQLRPSLLHLQHLKRLDLKGNNFTMRIPNIIGSLRKLTSLDITDAEFFGMIPPQFGNLSSLQTLNLGGNNLSTDNSQWLSHLSSLETLVMDDTNFNEASDWVSVIRELPILTSFTCEGCYFPKPDFSCTATHHVNFSSSLQTLYISGSYFSSSALSLLTNGTSSLSALYLSDLELEVPLPGIFNGMISLEMLVLSGNNLGVGIFDSIGNLCNLMKLTAYGCIIKESLSEILQALSGCAGSSLEMIDFESSNLTGTIPPMLNFQSLTDLHLSDNFLDSVPPVNETLLQHESSNISSTSFIIGSLTNTLPLFPASLTYLSLDNNHLNGVLSDLHFTNISMLQYLSLAQNPNLTVRINKPLTGAEFVDLRFCNLGPNYPSGLLELYNIRELDISHCMISSTIPILFWRNLSPSLLYLNLSSNSLYGTLPNIPFRFSDPVSNIDLSSNTLCGQVPFFFFFATGLYLSNNNFSGFAPIIPHLYNQPAFGYLYPYDVQSDPPNIIDLSNNHLSGLIPQWLGIQVPRLGALILTNNNLSGTIPSSIGNLLHLYVLSLRNNSFSGPLPSLLKNCTTLRILDLGGNRFDGFIPSWMGDLKSLIVFSFGSNSFTSTVPTSLCQITSLQVLDLSLNMLSGNIPACIQNFTAMASDVNSTLSVSTFDGDTTSYPTPLEERPYFNAYIKWKSHVWKFQSTLRLVKLIDLSSNNLSGEIPTGLTSLVELDSLDLSCNNLQGSIPEEIGQLKSLQYLNLSSNRLSGQIPASLSEISALEMLGLAHNNLSGRIPSGTQLRGFDPSAYSGNPYLCGMPLNKCPGDRDDSVQQPLQPSPLHDSEMEDKWPDEESFFAGLGTGFAFGFLGILASLTWITKWRYAFFHFATQFGEWIFLVVALNFSKFLRKLQLK